MWGIVSFAFRNSGVLLVAGLLVGMGVYHYSSVKDAFREGFGKAQVEEQVRCVQEQEQARASQGKISEELEKKYEEKSEGSRRQTCD